MSKDTKIVNWESDRIGHYVLSSLETMKRNLIKTSLEDVLGIDLEDINLIKDKKIKYQNSIVEGWFPGSESNISLDSTIALMNKYGNFYIPNEIKKFIKDCYDNEQLPLDNIPIDSEILEKGKAILDGFIEIGYNYYSACALTGATYVECGWNVHVVNKLEKNGDGVSGTSGWLGAGEGLFGLTFWSQKEKIIKKLSGISLPISSDPNIYKNDKANHLCDLNEEDWTKIAKIYLDDTAKKHNKLLISEALPKTDEEYTNILSASYLWKAACSKDPTLKNALEITERYMATHMLQSKSLLYKPKNSFAYQLVISIILDQFLHGNDKLSLKELKIDFEAEIDLDLSGFDYQGHMVNGTKYGTINDYLEYKNISENTNAEGSDQIPPVSIEYTIGSGTRAGVIKALGFSSNPTKEECGSQMTTINIEAYPGKKITIHKSLVEEVQAIFKELKIAGVVLNNKIGGYCFRPINNPSCPGSKTLSMHSFGCAIDINYNLNPFIKNGKPLNSGDDTPRGVCRTYNSPIVKAFAKYGWGWGGRYGDYMHFSKADGR